MRRVLGIAAGLALIAAALSPITPAEASCLDAAKKCGRDALIAIDVKAKGTPRAHPGGRVTYVLDYSMTWTPSFAPYWGSFWVGGKFPRGAQGPARAVLFDEKGKRLAAFTCRRHSDGVWCDTGGAIPHRGRIVLSARLARGGAGAAVAKLGFDSFDGLNKEQSARHLNREKSRAEFCNYRFTRTVTTRVDS
ncbi:hypothetical protein [Streptosporangium roseum]|uniref:Uncharacterized protein n=1 Tax=Streptosporangium roseum (strain ATCC 12428 / DSM 43021 / JCM 3005 / KCTC 9067 / NCIMB 10171 / NRRL 2505 / NI 9100) TaxID=479432 RepID=D2B055_STRRD|nr:hypothetical protein [Streptosporangium roseum]ACZ89061.1 hypothetical protein Sros_6340 [Streptosporangium roseum DSM 43021]